MGAAKRGRRGLWGKAWVHNENLRQREKQPYASWLDSSFPRCHLISPTCKRCRVRFKSASNEETWWRY